MAYASSGVVRHARILSFITCLGESLPKHAGLPKLAIPSFSNPSNFLMPLKPSCGTHVALAVDDLALDELSSPPALRDPRRRSIPAPEATGQNALSYSARLGSPRLSSWPRLSCRKPPARLGRPTAAHPKSIPAPSAARLPSRWVVWPSSATSCADAEPTSCFSTRAAQPLCGRLRRPSLRPSSNLRPRPRVSISPTH